jgi:hypothetical protein
MRWEEQVTQIRYEMQWTVRYFLYVSQKWSIPDHIQSMHGPGTTFGQGIYDRTGTNTRTGTNPGTGIHTLNTGTMTSGAISYYRRKKAIWEHLMIKADRMFARENNAYQSPL